MITKELREVQKELKYLIQRSASVSKEAPWGWIYAGDLQNLINKIENIGKETIQEDTLDSKSHNIKGIL